MRWSKKKGNSCNSIEGRVVHGLRPMATGVVILWTMPYTLRHPHIVNKLIFFLKQVIRDDVYCWFAIQWQKNESCGSCHSCCFIQFCITVNFFGALKMFCVAVFDSFAHCHRILHDRKISPRIWPKFWWPMRFFTDIGCVSFTLHLYHSTMTYIFSDPHSQSPWPLPRVPCTLCQFYLSLRPLDMIDIKLGN